MSLLEHKTFSKYVKQGESEQNILKKLQTDVTVVPTVIEKLTNKDPVAVHQSQFESKHYRQHQVQPPEDHRGTQKSRLDSSNECGGKYLPVSEERVWQMIAQAVESSERRMHSFFQDLLERKI